MTNPEIERLLTRYATGSLSEQERRVLFEAALQDQTVFDALQIEEPLRDVLADAASRQEIAAALEGPAHAEKRTPWWRGTWVVALAAGVATACVAIVLLARWQSESRSRFQTASASRPEAALSSGAPGRVPQSREGVGERYLTGIEPSPAPETKKQITPRATPAAARPAPRPPAPVAGGARAGDKQAQTDAAAGREKALRELGLAGKRQVVAMSKSFSSRNSALAAISVLRNGQSLGSTDTLSDGDSFQVRAVSPITGTVELFEQNPAGESKSLATEQVETGQVLTLPSTPLTLSGSEVLTVVFTAEQNKQTRTIQLDAGKPPVVR